MSPEDMQIDADPALRAARVRCAQAGETLTPLRARVLKLLRARSGAVKAYDLLPEMGDADGPAKPPTVYRALEFLVRMGLAHRLESLNAFAACDLGDCAHTQLFLICDSCGDAREVDAAGLSGQLRAAAETAGFEVRRTVLEASGLCAACRSPQ